MSFKICRGTLGSLPLWLILEIEIGKLLAIGVLHDEGFRSFLNRPGWREAAGSMGADHRQAAKVRTIGPCDRRACRA
jgi:hypothetical protein